MTLNESVSISKMIKLKGVTTTTSTDTGTIRNISKNKNLNNVMPIPETVDHGGSVKPKNISNSDKSLPNESKKNSSQSKVDKNLLDNSRNDLFENEDITIKRFPVHQERLLNKTPISNIENEAMTVTRNFPSVEKLISPREDQFTRIHSSVSKNVINELIDDQENESVATKRQNESSTMRDLTKASINLDLDDTSND